MYVMLTFADKLKQTKLTKYLFLQVNQKEKLKLLSNPTINFYIDTWPKVFTFNSFYCNIEFNLLIAFNKLELHFSLNLLLHFIGSRN